MSSEDNLHKRKIQCHGHRSKHGVRMCDGKVSNGTVQCILIVHQGECINMLVWFLRLEQKTSRCLNHTKSSQQVNV